MNSETFDATLDATSASTPPPARFDTRIAVLLRDDLATWQERQSESNNDRETAAWEARAEAPAALVVDFEDDVPEALLAANAYVEQPLSDYSAVDRRYRVTFASAEARSMKSWPPPTAE